MNQISVDFLTFSASVGYQVHAWRYIISAFEINLNIKIEYKWKASRNIDIL